MATFKFQTKGGSYVVGCQTSTEDKAWEWISQIKHLTVEQAKNLYVILKIEKNDD